MLAKQVGPIKSTLVMRLPQAYMLKLQPKAAHTLVAVMFVSFVLSLFARHAAFAWQPALDLRDNEIYSTLLPSSQS